LGPTIVSPVFYWMALVACLAAPLEAAPQATGPELPVSVDRIREPLADTSPARLKLDMPVEVPVAGF
jgi:hypothetical protein